MEIAARIHSVPFVYPPGTYVSNVYLVAGREAALIDSGWGGEAAAKSRVEYIRGLAPLRLAYILPTHAHPDHIGGAEAIRQATGAQILSHALDYPGAGFNYPRSMVDRVVEDGEIIDLGGMSLEVIHTPGHTPGHICFYLKGEGVLFTGDQVLGLGTTAIPPSFGDMGQFIDSLKKLLNYDIKLICPGHGPLVRHPRLKIIELIEHRLERERQVLAGLKRGKETVDELVAEVYPELPSGIIGGARGQVVAHLIKLEREHRVALVAGGRYTLIG